MNAKLERIRIDITRRRDDSFPRRDGIRLGSQALVQDKLVLRLQIDVVPDSGLHSCRVVLRQVRKDSQISRGG